MKRNVLVSENLIKLCCNPSNIFSACKKLSTFLWEKQLKNSELEREFFDRSVG